ncbi:MAG: hypothetical protein QG657_619 [Acidobacteriota bacterium]|nr:hypothetical protein [Acidobacteriota bacterium]
MFVTTDGDIFPGFYGRCGAEYAFIGAPKQEESGAFTEIQRMDSPVSEKGVDPLILPRILEQVANYCDRLRETSLNFFCIEEINEAHLRALEWRGRDRKEEKTYFKNSSRTDIYSCYMRLLPCLSGYFPPPGCSLSYPTYSLHIPGYPRKIFPLADPYRRAMTV